MGTPGRKFEIIRDIAEDPENVLNIKDLCEIAGISTRIYFPGCPEIKTDYPGFLHSNYLIPPEIGKRWKRGNEQLCWGYIVQYPSCINLVEQLAISVECDDAQSNSISSELYEAIDEWEHSFVTYLRLETKFGTERDLNIWDKTCQLELFDDKYIPRNQSIVIHGDIPGSEKAASVSKVGDAVSFASSGKEMFLEYQMMLSCYEARRCGRNRQAVIDACSAIELCLVKNIKKYLMKLGLEQKLFLDKFRTLNDRFELINRLDTSIQFTDYKDCVVKPRNAVVHNNTFAVADETVDKLIECVEKYLEHYFEGYY